MSCPSKLSSLFAKPHSQTIQIVALLVMLTAALYAPSLLNGFVWDDHFVITTNDFIHSWKNISLLFSREYLTHADELSLAGIRMIGSGELSYRPVVTLSYFLDWAVWEMNPFGYHLHNLIYHIFNTAFVYVLINLLTRSRWGAFGGALFFAWHPIHTEAISAIGNREDLQFFFFYITALLCYIFQTRAGDQKKSLLTFLSLCFFFLALFAKEMALTLPLMTFLYDYLYCREGRWRGFRYLPRGQYAGYFLIMAFYIYIRFFVIVEPGEIHELWLGKNIYTHLLILTKIIGVYLFWMIFPVGWHHIIPEDNSFAAHSLFEASVIFSMLTIIGSVTAGVFLRRRKPAVSFCIGWFFITLSPVMNFYPQQNFAALRYLYLPSVAFALALGLALAHWMGPQGSSLSRERKIVGSVLAALVLCFFAGSTVRGIAIWKDGIGFGRHLAQHYPTMPRIRCILGTYYLDLGLEDKAYAEFQTTLKLDPNYGKAYLCRGIIYKKRGELGKAQADMERALKLDPHLWHAHFHLGYIYTLQGQYRQAIDQYNQLLKFAPRQVAAYNNLGVLYLNLGELRLAERMWHKALEIDPDNSFTIQWLRELSARERGGK